MIAGVVASAHVDSALLADDFTGTDGAAWNSTRWPTTIGTTVNISTNRGHVAGNPAKAFSALTVTDFELVVKGQWANLTGKAPEIGWRVNSPFANPTGAGYAVQIDSTSGGKATMYKVPGYTVVAAGTVSATLAGPTAVWFRIRVVGTNHKIRWWADGGSEGSTWLIDLTDATTASGRVYLGSWSNGDTYWDDLTVSAA
jgi:hypothetical protein